MTTDSILLSKEKSLTIEVLTIGSILFFILVIKL